MANGAILGQSTTTWTNNQILSSATAALFGLGSDAVPDDVLAQLGGLANYHIWQKRTVTKSAGYTLKYASRVLLYSSNTSSTNGLYDLYLNVSSTINVGQDGKVELISPTTVTINGSTSASTVQSNLSGKFVSFYGCGRSLTDYLDPEKVYFCPSSVQINKSSYTFTIQSCKRVESYAATITEEYLFSSARDTYPDSGESGGSEYTYLGQLGSFGNRAQIITGSYVGTNAKVSITLPFAPKYFSVMDAEETSNYISGYWILGAMYFNQAETSASGYNTAVTVQDNVISYDGFNSGTKTYVYISFS